MNLFKTFGSFLHNRRVGRYFRRIALFESLGISTASRSVPGELARALRQAAHEEVPTLLSRLSAHADGLTEHEADAIRARVGPNEIAHEKPLPAWLHLWHCYYNLLNLLLTLLAVVSHLTEDDVHHRDRPDGGVVHADPASGAGRLPEPRRRAPQGDGQQHGDGAATRCRGHPATSPSARWCRGI